MLMLDPDTTVPDPTIALLLFAGHGEYLPLNPTAQLDADDPDRLKFTYINLDGDEQSPEDHDLLVSLNLTGAIQQLADTNHGGFEADPQTWWGQLLLIEGQHHQHRIAFQSLAAQLDTSLRPDAYGLGGDDNAYDYHPAGMDLLRSYAEDLDASAPASFSKDFYAHQAMKVYLNVCDHVFREAILRYRKDEPDLMSRGDSLNLKHWIELDCPETLEQIAKDLHNTHPSRLALIIDQLEHTHS